MNQPVSQDLIETARAWLASSPETVNEEATVQSLAALLGRVREEERELCAKVAHAHKGSAAKRRRERGDAGNDRIYSEEAGEDIAADEIAAAIRGAKP